MHEEKSKSMSVAGDPDLMVQYIVIPLKMKVDSTVKEFEKKETVSQTLKAEIAALLGIPLEQICVGKIKKFHDKLECEVALLNAEMGKIRSDFAVKMAKLIEDRQQDPDCQLQKRYRTLLENSPKQKKLGLDFFQKQVKDMAEKDKSYKGHMLKKKHLLPNSDVGNLAWELPLYGEQAEENKPGQRPKKPMTAPQVYKPVYFI